MVSRRQFIAGTAAIPISPVIAGCMPSIWRPLPTSEGSGQPGGASATAIRLQEQINALAAGGGGKLQLVSGEITIDRPLVVPRGVSIVGPGKDRCLIRNVYKDREGRYDFYRSGVFMPGNFHPAHTQALFGHPGSKTLAPFAFGDAAAALVRPDDAGDFAVGDVVVFFDQQAYTSAYRISRYLALRRITRIAGSTLHVDEPFRDSVSQGLAYNLRNGKLLGHGPGGQDSWLPLFAWGDGEIGGFSVDTAGHMISDSAVYKGAFHDIAIQRSRTIWYGNCYQHTQWDGVGGRFMIAAGELSHNSEACEVRNFDARYDARAAKSEGVRFSSAISMQENGLDVTYRDGRIDITGAERGNVVQIINFERAQVLDLTLRGRTAGFTGNVLSIANAAAANRRAARDGTFRLRWEGPCGRYAFVQGATASGNTIAGDFRGPPASGEAFRFDGTRERNVIAPGTRFEQGRGRLLAGTANQQIVRCFVGGGIDDRGDAARAAVAANRVAEITSAK